MLADSGVVLTGRQWTIRREEALGKGRRTSRRHVESWLTLMIDVESVVTVGVMTS